MQVYPTHNRCFCNLLADRDLLDTLFVEKQSRLRGWGRSLIQQAAAQAREHGFGALRVKPDRYVVASARAFLENVGFAPDTYTLPLT